MGDELGDHEGVSRAQFLDEAEERVADVDHIVAQLLCHQTLHLLWRSALYFQETYVLQLHQRLSNEGTGERAERTDRDNEKTKKQKQRTKPPTDRQKERSERTDTTTKDKNIRSNERNDRRKGQKERTD